MFILCDINGYLRRYKNLLIRKERAEKNAQGRLRKGKKYQID